MKNRISLLGIIAIVAIIGIGLAACCEPEPDPDPCENCFKIGAAGPSGGKIIYHNHEGFTVIGADSFTAYYLEAARVNQTDEWGWELLEWGYYSAIGATGTAIGTGKANTAAIIAAYNANYTAAKAAVAYTSLGKNDWFLPSKYELNEMYKARSHLGISSGNYWSSSLQSSSISAWYQSFNSGNRGDCKYNAGLNVRAVRAF